MHRYPIEMEILGFVRWPLEPKATLCKEDEYPLSVFGVMFGAGGVECFGEHSGVVLGPRASAPLSQAVRPHAAERFLETGPGLPARVRPAAAGRSPGPRPRGPKPR